MNGKEEDSLTNMFSILCSISSQDVSTFTLVFISSSQGPSGIPGLKGDHGKKGEKVRVCSTHKHSLGSRR